MHEPRKTDETVGAKAEKGHEAADRRERKLPEAKTAAEVGAHRAADEDRVEVPSSRLLHEPHEEDEDEAADRGAQVLSDIDRE